MSRALAALGLMSMAVLGFIIGIWLHPFAVAFSSPASHRELVKNMMIINECNQPLTAVAVQKSTWLWLNGNEAELCMIVSGPDQNSELTVKIVRLSGSGSYTVYINNEVFMVIDGSICEFKVKVIEEA